MNRYSTAFPHVRYNSWEKFNDLNSYRKTLNRYIENIDNVADMKKHLTKLYGVEWGFDEITDEATIDFATRRWHKERERILTFIDETLTMLREKIKQYE